MTLEFHILVEPFMLPIPIILSFFSFLFFPPHETKAVWALENSRFNPRTMFYVLSYGKKHAIEHFLANGSYYTKVYKKKKQDYMFLKVSTNTSLLEKILLDSIRVIKWNITLKIKCNIKGQRDIAPRSISKTI